MYTELWHEICFVLSENLPNEINEEAFENCVILALRALGWKQSSNDFDIRPSFPIGSSNRITPDFIINSKDRKKLFVIEIKQPNIPLTSGFQKQLFSYMRLLKLEYGILIGQAIQIFYDGNKEKQEDPVLLETIKFERNNEKGIRFAELFSKDNFSMDLLGKFTTDAIEKINRKEDFKTLTSRIISKDFKEIIINLIKQEFVNEYDGELIDSVLNDIEIYISKKNEPETNYASQIYNKSYYSQNSKPGVISSIVNLISEKPKTYEEILQGLVHLFPERSRDSMMNTIKAQLGGKNPLRIEKEKNISVEIVIDNKNVKSYLLKEPARNLDYNYKNENIIENHIHKSYNKSIEEFSEYLADRFTTDKRQKEIFLRKGVWLKVKLNYIAGLLLKERGQEIFTPKDIRDIIREEIITSLTEIDDSQLSGMLLTSDVHKNAVDPRWHNGYPCLEKISKGHYKFIGFTN